MRIFSDWFKQKVTEMKSKQSRHAQLFMLMACLIGTNNAAAHDGVLHDVVYGVISGVSLTMDVYQPTESNHRGIILVPGSGWKINFCESCSTANGNVETRQNSGRFLG